MVGTFDSIDKDVLAMLSPEKAVELLHKLIYAELNRLRITPEFISIPLEINNPDGGIDGTVIIDGEVTGSELIFPGKTYYQVKSGRNVKYSDSGLESIVCVKSSGSKEKELKPKIREIVEEDGTLVLFFTGKSDPGAEDAEKKLFDILKAYCPQTTVKVRIIQAENIIGILDQYLPIRVWLCGGRLEFPGKLFDEWSEEPLMRKEFKTDEKRDKIIKNLRSLAQSEDPDSNVIRVSGFPGNGKTRSVLETLRGSGLEPLVVYFGKPSDMIGKGYNHHRAIARSDDHAVVVVDECDKQSHCRIAEAFANTGSRVKLITIYNESSYQVVPAKYIDFNEDEALEESTISEIIKSYGISEHDARRWAPYCDGSPRVAHMIAENLSNETGDMLRNPSYDSAMERFLANKDDLRSEEFKLRKKILSWLSLFKRFGWSKEFEEERAFIIRKIRSETSCSKDEILEVVNDLKRRKVLQGDKTLYISPRLLHIRAWVWWWESYKDMFGFDDFRLVKSGSGEPEAVIPDELYGWFTEMFEYAHEVAGASALVKDLLAIDGPLSSESRLREALVGGFLLNLTTADPESSLSLLERWFKGKTDDDLRNIRQGRMNLVRCLERIAVWESLFSRAARLLLRVAATEGDQTYNNNSEGTFAGLFSNGPSKTAPTEAPPPQRYPVMENAVKSGDPRYVRTGLAAISQALQSIGFTRSVGPEIQGLRAEPQLWCPDTWGEVFGAIQAAWNLLLSVLPSLEGDLKEEALKVIDCRISGLLFKSSAPESYLKDYTRLIKNGTMPRKYAINTVQRMRRDKNFSPEVRDGIRELSEYLDSGDIDALLERYVRHNSVLDWFVDDQNIAKSTSKLTDIARVTTDNPHILSDNLWLFTKKAVNSYRLGQKLSELDMDMRLLDRLCVLQKESAGRDPEIASCNLLAWYLIKASQGDKGRWQEILSRIENDPVLVRWYAEICCATNFDDRNADTILRLIREGKIEKTALEVFERGGVTKKISHAAFDRWVEFLLKQDDVRSINTAIGLFFQHYINKENYRIPQELSLRLLTSETLVSEDSQKNVNDMTDFYWSEIADRYIDQHPASTDRLREFIIENYGEYGTVLNRYNKYAQDLMNKLIKKDPEKAWESVAKQLDGEKLNYRWPELGWLGGGGKGQLDRPISIFPKNLVFNWIAENPSERAPKIARIVPKDFDSEPTKDSWFKDILHQYGGDEDVQDALTVNNSGVFTGRISDYCANELERIRRFGLNNKDSDNIQTWVAKASADLEQKVNWARMREERRDF